jgi:hypothetical protein
VDCHGAWSGRQVLRNMRMLPTADRERFWPPSSSPRSRIDRRARSTHSPCVSWVGKKVHDYGGDPVNDRIVFQGTIAEPGIGPGRGQCRTTEPALRSRSDRSQIAVPSALQAPCHSNRARRGVPTCRSDPPDRRWLRKRLRRHHHRPLPEVTHGSAGRDSSPMGETRADAAGVGAGFE